MATAEAWTAMYMPASDRDGDPTQSGFPSEEAAWQYVFGRMCPSCKKERAQALAEPEKSWESDYEPEDEGQIPPSKSPACSAEWCVMLTSEYLSLSEG